MRIGIFGCGYVGLALAVRLKRKGHHLCLSTTREEKKEILNQVGDEVIIVRAKKQDEVDHFLKDLDALFVTVAPVEKSSYEDTYLATAKAISNSLKKSPGKLAFLAYTSTTSVYGHHEGGWVTEESKLLGNTPNAKTLIETEEIYRSLDSDQRRVSIMRLGHIYGPGRELENFVRGKSGATLSGKGRHHTNMVQVEDIARALTFCFDHKLHDTFNLCNHTHLPYKTFYNSVCMKEGWPAPNWDETESMNHFKQNKRVSSEKIETLGFRFNYPEAFDWLKANSGEVEI